MILAESICIDSFIATHYTKVYRTLKHSPSMCKIENMIQVRCQSIWTYSLSPVSNLSYKAGKLHWPAFNFIINKVFCLFKFCIHWRLHFTMWFNLVETVHSFFFVILHIPVDRKITDYNNQSGAKLLSYINISMLLSHISLLP